MSILRNRSIANYLVAASLLPCQCTSPLSKPFEWVDLADEELFSVSLRGEQQQGIAGVQI